jgi:CHAD domain-containing protein
MNKTGKSEYLKASTALWFAARTLLKEKGDDFFALLERAPRTLDAEDFHDLRVASRRLREGLRLFVSCYPAGELDRLGKKVSRITRLLGEVRNLDEAILFFGELANSLEPPAYESAENFLSPFRQRRQKAVNRLGPQLRALHAGPLQKQFYRTIRAPFLFRGPGGDSPQAFTPLGDFAREALNGNLAAVLELIPAASREEEVAAQHRLRIAVKHFRYRMEILSFLIGEKFPPLLHLVKNYQDVLGKMHDLDVFAEDVIREGEESAAASPLLEAIAGRRHALFDQFGELLMTSPLAGIGEVLRRAW